MTKNELYKGLNYVNHSREKRMHYAKLLSNQPELIELLLEILFDVEAKISCKAGWIFEFMCSEKPAIIIPHLDTFTQNISKVHLDSAVRPVAKVCESLVKNYYAKYDITFKTHLTAIHKEKIIEACFDWLINDGKIAPKAYAMNALYLLGTDCDWIHPELAIIIERDFQMQSSGFKARARHILKKIKT